MGISKEGEEIFVEEIWKEMMNLWGRGIESDLGYRTVFKSLPIKEDS